MNRAIALILLLSATSASAVPGGEIGTLATGTYRCELPGDASGPVGLRMPDRDFTVQNASSYAVAQGGGNYLLTGTTVTMTSGPMLGQRFRRISANVLRELTPTGDLGALRCIRAGSNR